MARTPDVVVVGGGVVGTALAWRLAKDGRSVVLLERGEIGREATWAAGGILTPVHLADYPAPLAALCDASAKIYPGLVRELRDFSTADPEYRVTGFLIVERNDAEAAHTASLEAFKKRSGQPAERLGPDALRALQPGLSADVRGALFLPDIAQVRNTRVAVALAEAAQKKGVEIRRNAPVTGFLRVPGRVNGVRTPRATSTPAPRSSRRAPGRPTSSSPSASSSPSSPSRARSSSPRPPRASWAPSSRPSIPTSSRAPTARSSSAARWRT